MNYFRVLFFLVLFSFEYNFVCFAGESLKSQHFEVFYDGFRKSYAEQALMNSEKSYRIISETLGHNLQKPISINFTGSDKQFRELTRGTLPEWSDAVAMPDNRIIVTPLPGRKHNLNRILAHEIVHIVINDAAGEIFVPRWFHEGCAQNLSGEWGIRGRLYLVWKVTRGELLTFDDIQDVFSSRNADAALAYDQSMLAIRYFIDKNGRDVLPAVINDMKKGNDFALAFWKTSGLWPGEFEQDYLMYIRRTYGKKTLYYFIPSTWTLILLIAVIVYFVKKRRNKRLMQQWEIIETAENIINFEGYKRNNY